MADTERSDATVNGASKIPAIPPEVRRKKSVKSENAVSCSGYPPAGNFRVSPRTLTSLASRVLGVFPAWVGDNLRSVRSWKTLARCWVATWASLIVILPTRSLTTLGNVAFFCLLGSLMVPPSMPVQMFVLVIALIIGGQLLGWALGVATMRAALAARDMVLLRSQYEAAQQTAATAANPDIAFRIEIFQGVFLDIRSSVVYAVMFGAFSFMFALGRAYRPQLLLFFTFAQIFLDVFCTFGPLFPNTEYTILSSILISMSVYMAIGIVCCIFIFPETMNHAYLVQVTKLLDDLKNYAGLCGSILELSPEDIGNDSIGSVDRCIKQRMELILSMRDLQQKSKLIDVEFSFGRWSGSDVKALEEPLRVVVARMGSFYTFLKTLSSTPTPSLSRSTTNSVEGSSASSFSTSENMGDTELIRQLNSRRYALESEKNVRMSDIMPLVYNSTAALRASIIVALGAAQDMIQETNTRRWKRDSKVLVEKQAALDKALERIRFSAVAYKSKERLTIIEPFLPLLHIADEDRQQRKQLPLRSLIVSSSLVAQFVVSIDGLIDLLEVIQKTTHKRQKARLWAPGGLRALGNFIIRKEKDGSLERSLGENAGMEIEEEDKNEEAPFRRDPDSKPPTNIVQRFMSGLHGVYTWTKSVQVMFAMKYMILTILLWLPAVIRSSAEFYYVEKGVWALIMGQQLMNVYSSDSIYSMVTRFLGTFLGLIVGLLVWYIGNGSGNGNPYGIAAAYGVFVIPVLFVRIHAPPALLQPVIMLNATLALIVGYSWIDAKLNVVGNPGVGWPIAWKRFVLVAIGVGAAAIMTMIPPVSGRKALRLQSAAFINELSSVYSTLMSVWIMEEEADNAEGGQQPDGADKEGEVQAKSAAPSVAPAFRSGWAISLRKRILGLVEQLHSMQMQTAMAKFEGNIRGAWPAEEYGKLLEREADMVAALSQLSIALQHLDPSWRASLIHRTMILNPNFITDVISIFALVSQSLRTGEPMHQILPTSLLDRLLYHHTHDALSRREEEPVENMNYVDRANSLEFVFYSTGITAVSQVIQSLDEMHRITRRLCGEVPFQGFNEWKNDYDRAFRSV